MNLLIVDDEINSLVTVSHMINKEKLSICQCFQAESVQEAKRYLANESIDIVLCDIEMPQESGLELLAWISQENLPAECIIMTCHAEFEYARKVVRLGSCAYLLKPIDPVELEAELLNAIHTKETKSRLKEHSRSWMRSQDVIREKFWSLLFQGEILSEPASIRHWLTGKSIDIHTDWKYCPILFVTRQWSTNIAAEDYNLFRFALKNIMLELFTEKFNFGMCDMVQFENDVNLVIIGADSISSEMYNAVGTICNEYLLIVKQYIGNKINCYIGIDIEIQEVANEIESLYQIDSNNLWNEGVIEHRKYNRMISEKQSIVDLQEFERWLKQLLKGEFLDVEKSIYHYLDYQTNIIAVNRKWLSSFHRQYIVMLSAYAAMNKYYLSQIMENEDLYHSLAEYNNGIEELKKLIDISIKALYQFEQKKLNNRDPVEITKNYIEIHLADKLDMETLSQNVYLNPDYLTRIFHKKTGESINKYIVNLRIKKAKHLLELTNQPISEIAFQIGYFNYISFNRIFTKAVGVSPQIYRQNSRSK